MYDILDSDYTTELFLQFDYDIHDLYIENY